MALTKDHYISLKDGKFDATSKEDLGNLFKTLAADPHRDHLVLHFHGELTGAASAMGFAESLMQRYQDINTFKLFADTLQTCKDRIASIRIFAMEDHLEQTDVLVTNLYTRSLLYLVSGIFEDVADTPILGMQRFFSNKAPFNKWPEISDVLNYLRTSQHNNVWSVIDGGDGLSSHAQHHGIFYSEDVTLKSLGYILQKGLL